MYPANILLLSAEAVLEHEEDLGLLALESVHFLNFIV